MKLELRRDTYLSNGTTGKLSVDDKEFCYTLEPPNETSITDGPVCIPSGVYPVVIDFSPRFQRQMPRVENVPERSGILVHWGNYVEDTQGCILVGSSRSMIQGSVPEPAVWASRETFERLYREIEGGRSEGVVLAIRDADVTSAEERAVRAPLSAASEKR